MDLEWFRALGFDGAVSLFIFGCEGDFLCVAACTIHMSMLGSCMQKHDNAGNAVVVICLILLLRAVAKKASYSSIASGVESVTVGHVIIRANLTSFS